MAARVQPVISSTVHLRARIVGLRRDEGGLTKHGNGRFAPSPLRLLGAGLGVLVAVGAVVLWVRSGHLAQSVTLVGHARPGYVWLAGLGFAGSLVATAGAWRSTLAGCGGRVGRLESCARYGVGSLLNSFLPARLGDAARVALFARTLPRAESPALTAGSVLGAVEVARALVQALLIAIAAAIGAVPFWPVLALGAAAGVAVLVVLRLRRRWPGHRLVHLLDGLAALLRSPRRAAVVIAWVAAASLCQVAAAAAIAASLGVSSPLAAALIVIAALDIAASIPFTPGNVGITSTAVALALQSRGVGVTTALASGLALHAVETLVGVTFGALSVALLAKPSAMPGPARGRLVLGASALVLASAFAATMLVDVG